MSRDPWRLKVFALADDLVVRVYRATRGLPPEERYGLQSQLRRAAVSVPANLVEGSARRTLAEYLRFVEIALGSASETRYLLDLSRRLGFLDKDVATDLITRYANMIRGMQTLIGSLQVQPRGPRPEA
jgi:four helix bundle protein